MTEGTQAGDPPEGLRPHPLQRAEQELAHDRRAERLLLWKGLLALLLMLCVAYVRHRYFL